MSVPDTPGPLPRPLLERLGDRPDRAATDPDQLERDMAVLRDSGYLKLAVPASLGGAGFSLRQVACAQRQLAARAPAAALAVTAHHAWAGAAADTLASGNPDDAAAKWVLREVGQSRFFAGLPGQLRRTGQPWEAARGRFPPIHPSQLRRTGQPDGAGHGGGAHDGDDGPGGGRAGLNPRYGECTASASSMSWRSWPPIRHAGTGSRCGPFMTGRGAARGWCTLSPGETGSAVDHPGRWRSGRRASRCWRPWRQRWVSR